MKIYLQWTYDRIILFLYDFNKIWGHSKDLYLFFINYLWCFLRIISSVHKTSRNEKIILNGPNHCYIKKSILIVFWIYIFCFGINLIKLSVLMMFQIIRNSWSKFYLFLNSFKNVHWCYFKGSLNIIASIYMFEFFNISFLKQFSCMFGKLFLNLLLISAACLAICAPTI